MATIKRLNSDFFKYPMSVALKVYFILLQLFYFFLDSIVKPMLSATI